MLKTVPVPGQEQKSPQVNLPQFLHELRRDLSVEEISALIIDEPAYYWDHKDVLKAKMPAAVHYFRYGEKEKGGRTYHYPRLGYSKTLSPRVVVRGLDVYYTTAEDDNASWLYRCVYPFKSNKESIFISGTSSLSNLLISVFAAKRLILLRPTYSPRTTYLIQLCRRIGVHVQFDYDDLLLPEFARQRGACRSGLRTHTNDFKESLMHSSIVAYADSLTCSTESIATELRKLHDDVQVRKNKLPSSMFVDHIDLLSRFAEGSIDRNKLKILYLSGSNTHKRDFSGITGSLLRLAQEIPEKFSITFMGTLSDYSGIFKSIGVESGVKPLLVFSEMLKVISEHDLVLVPLEFSVFNHCKSNIKYIESASQGVPVIASSVAEFASAIEDGVNGWLCDTDDDWYEKLKLIAMSPKLTQKCGEAAYLRAKSEFSI